MEEEVPWAHACRSRRAALFCNAFGPQLWTSCPAGTRKAEGSAALPSRVQQRCPRAPSPEPCKGRRPKNRHSKKGETFSVLVSWPACAGAFLVPGPCFSGPAPSGSGLFWFRLVFLSTGRGRHVPAPSGRDVGSSSGAPTQGPAFSGIPLRTALLCTSSRLFTSSRLPCSSSSSLFFLLLLY